MQKCVLIKASGKGSAMYRKFMFR